MSGPYCETCKHFLKSSLLPPNYGYCEDSAKIIWDRNGNRVNEQPDVHQKYTCTQHKIAAWTSQGERLVPPPNETED